VEIVLPLTYNDGSDIEPKKFFDIKEEVLAKFGGVSTDDAIIDGAWIDPVDGKAYYDRCKKLLVDVDNTAENRSWFEMLKEKLKIGLKQKEIYVVCSQIEQL